MSDGNVINKSSLSILTWKSPETLHATLQSLVKIAAAFPDRLVLCQEGDDREIALAKKFGYRAEITNQNLGIMGGLKEAVLRAKFETVLLLENDVCFIGTASDIAVIHQLSRYLKTEDISFACLMDRRSGPRPRYFKYWKDSWPPRPTLKGLVQFTSAKAIKADAIALTRLTETDCDFAVNLSQSLWQTQSQYYAWSNRAKYVNKSFFLGQLIPYAEQNPTRRHINGFMDLEHQINSKKQRQWYRQQAFKIIIHQSGLFGHERYDRADNDEKQQLGLPIITRGGRTETS